MTKHNQNVVMYQSMLRTVLIFICAAFLTLTLLLNLFIDPARALASGDPVVVVLTEGTEWTVPEDWNPNNNTIHLIGAGGGGAGGLNAGGGSPTTRGRPGGGGGGGGGYTTLSNFDPGESATVTYAIGAGGTAGAVAGAGGNGGTTSWDNGAHTATGGDGGAVGADAENGGGGIGGAGGTGTRSGGTGGTGGNASAADGGSGGGGAGAAGNNAAGSAGGSGFTTTPGDGGDGDGGTTNGGGAGGNSSTPAGGNGTNISSSSPNAGSGGGGRGGAGSVDSSSSAATAGAAAGQYGAGGGGGGGASRNASTGAVGSAGAQGVIVIVYTPVEAPTVTASTTTAISTSTATFNGNITATGGENASTRGFIYSTSSDFSSGVATTSEIGGAYDISTANFDSVVLEVWPQEMAPLDMLFNNDGSILYVVGADGADINAYPLDTPYNISSYTSGTSVVLDVSGQETSPTDMLFNDDGSTLYVMGTTGDDINAYPLDTPYDISSYTSGTSVVLDVSGQESLPRALLYNDDGTILYMLGAAMGDINAYILESVPTYTTGTYSRTTADLLPDTTYYVRAFAENSGGLSYSTSTELFTTLTGPPAVEASPATNIGTSTATFNGNITATGGENASTRGFIYSTSSNFSSGVATTSESGTYATGTYNLSASALSPNTTYYIRAFATNNEGVGYSDVGSFTTLVALPALIISDTTNISTSTATFNGNITSVGGENASTRGFIYSTSSDFSSGVATTSDIGGAYDINTASFDSIALDVSGQDTSPTAMLYNNDGSTLYVMGAGGDDINAYLLSSPYDISTATFDSIALSVATEEISPLDMLFNNDGTVLYVMGIDGDDINAYPLDTPYDISSYTSGTNVVLDVSGQETSPTAMLFNDDGTTLYVMGTVGDDINAYTLSTPYDISTATFDSIALSVATEEITPTAMLFNDDGTVLYVMGFDDVYIDTYTLSTPYDISTATFDSIALDVSVQETSPYAMLFNNDGTTLYVMGSAGDDINAYTLGGVPTYTTGTYSRTAADLLPDTTYYVRAFAENSGGLSYSTSTESFTTSGEAGVTKDVTLNNHTTGQADNVFSYQNQTDATFFAFQLSATTTNTVSELTVNLTGNKGVAATELENFRLFADTNSNGVYDSGTDTQVGGTASFDLAGQNGSVAFTSNFSFSATTDYILVGDTAGIDRGDSLNFSLVTNDIIFTDTDSINGFVDSVQHSRSGAGGRSYQSSGGQIGDPAPEGDGVVTGGGKSGGNAIDTNSGGETISDGPEFKAPTADTGSWLSSQQAYDKTDGTYATTSTATTHQYTTFDFSIPSTNTIEGVLVELESSIASAGSATIELELSWDGGTSWTSSKVTSSLTTTDTLYTLGGASDTWGRIWSPSEFSSSNFRARVTSSTEGPVIQLDELQVRAYHQASGGGAGGGGAI